MSTYYVGHIVYDSQGTLGGHQFLVAFLRNARGCQFWPSVDGSHAVLPGSHQLGQLGVLVTDQPISAHGGLSRHAGGGVAKSPIVGWFTVLSTLYLYEPSISVRYMICLICLETYLQYM